MFRAWPKIPRLENEIYHITEKIDGTNAAIIIQQNLPNYPLEPNSPLIWWEEWEDTTINTAIWAQSRSRLIYPEEDNFGFAAWVRDNAEQLINDLGEGYHYGEWWGQGINRGYGLDHKRFSLFNPTKYSDICYHVPLLVSCDFYDLELSLAKEGTKLRLHGSHASPGYMRPEGLVVYAEKAKTYWKVIVDK